MLVRIKLEARVDLEDAADFYNTQAPGLGDVFLEHMDAQFVELSRTAGIHRTIHDCYRKLVPKFPYAIYYRIIDNRAEIVAIFNQRRDQRILRNRLGA